MFVKSLVVFQCAKYNIEVSTHFSSRCEYHVVIA
jgi:hypothetical protein